MKTYEFNNVTDISAIAGTYETIGYGGGFIKRQIEPNVHSFFIPRNTPDLPRNNDPAIFKLSGDWGDLEIIGTCWELSSSPGTIGISVFSKLAEPEFLDGHGKQK